MTTKNIKTPKGVFMFSAIYRFEENRIYLVRSRHLDHFAGFVCHNSDDPGEIFTAGCFCGSFEDDENVSAARSCHFLSHRSYSLEIGKLTVDLVANGFDQVRTHRNSFLSIHSIPLADKSWHIKIG